jgi:hypothetical protein
VDTGIIAGGALATCDCSALEPGLIFISALMPENNRACVPSKTVACDSASCSLPDSHQLGQSDIGKSLWGGGLADWQQCQCSLSLETGSSTQTVRMTKRVEDAAIATIHSLLIDQRL